jgi:hypothetical protein
MDRQEAGSLLSILARGIDPITGEILPDDHVCQQPAVIRALYVAADALQANAAAPKEKPKSKHENAGAKWTPELDQQVREAAQRNESIGAIAKILGRSSGSIASRMVRLGLVESREDARLGAYFSAESK